MSIRHDVEAIVKMRRQLDGQRRKSDAQGYLSFACSLSKSTINIIGTICGYTVCIPHIEMAPIECICGKAKLA